MIFPHSEGAIAMANQLLQEGKQPALRSIAHDISDAQTTEIAQMRVWRKVWYGSARSGDASGRASARRRSDNEQVVGVGICPDAAVLADAESRAARGVNELRDGADPEAVRRGRQPMIQSGSARPMTAWPERCTTLASSANARCWSAMN